MVALNNILVSPERCQLQISEQKTDINVSDLSHLFSVAAMFLQLPRVAEQSGVQLGFWRSCSLVEPSREGGRTTSCETTAMRFSWKVSEMSPELNLWNPMPIYWQNEFYLLKFRQIIIFVAILQFVTWRGHCSVRSRWPNRETAALPAAHSCSSQPSVGRKRQLQRKLPQVRKCYNFPSIPFIVSTKKFEIWSSFWRNTNRFCSQNSSRCNVIWFESHVAKTLATYVFYAPKYDLVHTIYPLLSSITDFHSTTSQSLYRVGWYGTVQIQNLNSSSNSITKQSQKTCWTICRTKH